MPTDECASSVRTETTTLLVERVSGKEFRIIVPKTAKITFGPFSPPTKGNGYMNRPEGATGTLRIYDKMKERCIAVFAGVVSYRDLSLNYEEKVAVEEGATIWKNDETGYSRESKVTGTERWVTPVVPALPEADDDKEIPF